MSRLECKTEKKRDAFIQWQFSVCWRADPSNELQNLRFATHKFLLPSIQPNPVGIMVPPMTPYTSDPNLIFVLSFHTTSMNIPNPLVIPKLPFGVPGPLA